MVALLAIALTLWLVNQPMAEGRPTDGLPPEIVDLTAPADFSVSASEDDADTAFRENEAGFSAYYRFTNKQGNPVALDVHGITGKLLLMPDESNSVRAQKAGRRVDTGLNFGIVTLPMVAAVGVVVPPQEVTVYYDNQGWIAAYLAPDQPAAAIWRHDTRDEKTTGQELGDNLLVLAINEVIGAHNEARPNADPLVQVTHNGDADGNHRVEYYDWQNGACNAFVMFITTSNGGESDPVQFVIPHAIKTAEIHASAAALITKQQATGSQTLAATMVDNAMAIFALADEMLRAASFTLEREDGKTSLHTMSVSVGAGEPAAGAVMLLYKRPS